MNETSTLAERAEGRLPTAEALRLAMQLADVVRKLHHAGQVSPISLQRGGPSPEVLQMEEIQARIDRGFEVLHARVATIERNVEEMRRRAVQFEHNTAADLVDIEQGLKLQTASIESARTAMAQTDDLVERVVEVLESVQTAILVQDEVPAERASLAVN